MVMFVLKIIFSILICVPLAYLAAILFFKMREYVIESTAGEEPEVDKKSKKYRKQRKAERKKALAEAENGGLEVESVNADDGSK